MRKNQEINKAVAILRKKGDLVSLEQASVLSDRLNERSVFDKYVAGVAEADRSKIAELFGDVTMIDAGIAGECGFITPVMKEKVFAEKAEKLTSMITRIRVNA